jgi:hypothetical protein
VPWDVWYARQQVTFTQGQHLFIGGPTQSGKTTLTRLVVDIRDYTVVLGTKPNEDPALVAYQEAGYLRIDHWPPTRSDIRKMPTDKLQFLVWPKLVEIDDAQKHRHLYEHVLKHCYVDGRWCVVIDEGLFFADKNGLDLAVLMGQLAYGSASNKVSLVVLGQRAVGLGPITWVNTSQALLFHMGKVDDVRDLASLGTYPPRAAEDAVASLGAFEFLDLPTRAQAEWSISRVDADVI